MRERTIKKFGDLSAFEERQSNMKAAVDAYKTRCPYVFEIDASQPISKFLPQLADDLTSVRDRLRN